MTHHVRFKIQLGAGIFEYVEVCICLAFLHRQKKSLTLGSEIMCHVMLRLGTKAKRMVVYLGSSKCSPKQLCLADLSDQHS